jgi:hypothetical protein
MLREFLLCTNMLILVDNCIGDAAFKILLLNLSQMMVLDIGSNQISGDLNGQQLMGHSIKT